MRKLLLVLMMLGLSHLTLTARAHEMQHGFILSNEDQFASHLVATGHHSWQVDVIGSLTINDPQEKEIYAQRKALNTEGQVYFLLQAQNLNLPTLNSGQTLKGHIIESAVGNYEPKNIIVKEAEFKIEKVLLKIENPFFKDE